MSSSLGNFTELQERVIKLLIDHPLHRDDIAKKLDVKPNQITRTCNLLKNGTFEYVREIEKQTWQITARGRALRFKSKSQNNNLKVLRSKGEIELDNKSLDILSALSSFTSAHVKPCKADLFAACQENDEDMRWVYYSTVDTLVTNGHITEHKENYGSAVFWVRYSLTNPDLLKSA